MQKSINIAIALGICATFLLAGTAQAAPSIDKPAPQFIGVDSNGKQVALEDFKGKTVVLEWTNHDCPYVRRHYGTGNMQKTQKQATAKDVVWLSVISSAPGLQGHVDGKQANELTVSRKASPTHVILDPTGKIGKTYGARTTPHMYIVDPKGALVYKGGIDDNPTSWGEIGKNTKNYVLAALNEMQAGKKVSKTATRAYGCSVKYGS